VFRGRWVKLVEIKIRNTRNLISAPKYHLVKMFVDFIVFPEILCTEKKEEALDEHKEEAKVEGDQVSLAKWLEQWNYNLEPPSSISTLRTILGTL